MLNFLGECMALAGKVMIGTMLWFGLILGVIAIIAILYALLRKTPEAQKVVDLQEYKKNKEEE